MTILARKSPCKAAASIAGAMMALLVGSMVLLAGCVTPKSPDLGDLYSPIAQQHGPDQNPIIVIPGLMGSRLKDVRTGEMAWGVFEPGVADPRNAESIRRVSFPMEPGVPLSEITDGITALGAVDRIPVRLFTGIWVQPEAYLRLLLMLGAHGYADQTLGQLGAINYGHDHYTCFQFGYDWRRSCAEGARDLHEFMVAQKALVEEENLKRFGRRGEVRFDIVAHSMGALVARYYLRYGPQPLPENGLPKLTWEGARLINKLILVAPPNAGSAEALRQLTQGFTVIPWQGKYQPAVLGSMPSSYELLPRARHGSLRAPETGEFLDPLDPAVWEKYEWGLADPDQDDVLKVLLPDIQLRAERRRIALDHLHKCLGQARRFHEAIDLPATPPPSVKISLFAGDAADTPAYAVAEPGEARIIGFAPGDGTVARYSALMDERTGQTPDPAARLQSPIAWHSVTFLFESHLGLTRSRTFADNVLFRLLEEP